MTLTSPKFTELNSIQMWMAFKDPNSLIARRKVYYDIGSCVTSYMGDSALTNYDYEVEDYYYYKLFGKGMPRGDILKSVRKYADTY